MRAFALIACTCLAQRVVGQQIYDVVSKHAITQRYWADLYLFQWQTTWDRAKLFSSVGPSTPINFVTPGAIGDADIVVNDGTTYQSIAGFGGTLSEYLSVSANYLVTEGNN